VRTFGAVRREAGTLAHGLLGKPAATAQQNATNPEGLMAFLLYL
jgi:hypothetical protein